MELLWQILLWLLGTVVFDWIVAGRLAALMPSVEYRYWPLSAVRLITLMFLSTALAADSYLDYQIEWPLWVTLVALITYVAAIMADLERQRERGPLPDALRYGESDADY